MARSVDHDIVQSTRARKCCSVISAQARQRCRSLGTFAVGLTLHHTSGMVRLGEHWGAWQSQSLRGHRCQGGAWCGRRWGMLCCTLGRTAHFNGGAGLLSVHGGSGHEWRRAQPSDALHVLGQGPHEAVHKCFSFFVASFLICWTAGTSTNLRTDHGFRDGHGARDSDSGHFVGCALRNLCDLSDATSSTWTTRSFFPSVMHMHGWLHCWDLLTRRGLQHFIYSQLLKAA